MTIVVRLLILGLSVALAPLVAEAGSESRQYWDEIKVLHEKGDPGTDNPDLELYLKSLSPEEMITAAQQACEKHAPYGIVLCFKHYVDNSDNVGKGMGRGLELVSDAREHRDLRRALIQQMSCSPFNRFVDELQTYVDGHISEAHAILTKILENRREDVVLRDAAMSTIAEGLREQVIKGCAADPNVRAVKERTNKIVPVGEMVRAGQLTLTDNTWQVLKPMEDRCIEVVVQVPFSNRCRYQAAAFDLQRVLVVGAAGQCDDNGPPWPTPVRVRRHRARVRYGCFARRRSV